jgi:hypothetical protein
MAEPVPDHWQIQEAKQRFSEMIRAVTSQGPLVRTSRWSSTSESSTA